MAGLALGWLLAQPGLAALVIGPMRVEHLDPVREAIEHPLDAATVAEIAGLLG
jgi:aryl-alcohol dehydrogenase-like predicted oxidoreductase